MTCALRQTFSISSHFQYGQLFSFLRFNLTRELAISLLFFGRVMCVYSLQKLRHVQLASLESYFASYLLKDSVSENTLSFVKSRPFRAVSC